MDFDARQFDFAPAERCVVIGEVGVNHNNDRDTLFRLIDAGVEAGCDLIKLQRFKAEEEIAVTAPTTDYQVKAGEGESQLEMAKKLELPDAWLVEAHAHCRQRGVGFLCTAFDHGSVDFVADVLGCRSVKVPSPEMTNRPLIEYMAQKFDSLLISTGASNLDEVAAVIEWINNIGEREIALMHCTSEYPAPVEQANLLAIRTMREAFALPVGYSDHTVGVTAGTIAASLGASMIEKHYTLDKNMPGPDHSASADIPELIQLVQAMHTVHAGLGDGVKRPVQAEVKNLPLIRKGFTCALETMPAGTVIEASMLGIKRPLVEDAVQPYDLDKILGKKIRVDKRYDEPILWSDFGQ